MLLTLTILGNVNAAETEASIKPGFFLRMLGVRPVDVVFNQMEKAAKASFLKRETVSEKLGAYRLIQPKESNNVSLPQKNSENLIAAILKFEQEFKETGNANYIQYKPGYIEVISNEQATDYTSGQKALSEEEAIIVRAQYRPSYKASDKTFDSIFFGAGLGGFALTMNYLKNSSDPLLTKLTVSIMGGVVAATLSLPIAMAADSIQFNAIKNYEIDSLIKLAQSKNKEANQ